jgi:hypothetical protein
MVFPYDQADKEGSFTILDVPLRVTPMPPTKIARCFPCLVPLVYIPRVIEIMPQESPFP